jgi:DNA-binding ferritin-like protein (Dps family)
MHRQAQRGPDVNIWEKVTGSDLTRDWRAFEARAEVLPAGYQAAWGQIRACLMPYGTFTGRNLTPILDLPLGLLEEASAENQSVAEVLGDDIPGFCAALAGGQGARTYRDRWREQLNANVARRLGRLGG